MLKESSYNITGTIHGWSLAHLQQKRGEHTEKIKMRKKNRELIFCGDFR